VKKTLLLLAAALLAVALGTPQPAAAYVPICPSGIQCK
jgi:hypothetical protein